MLRPHWLIPCIVLVAPSTADEGLNLFHAKIAPALAEHCLRCHASDQAKPKGGLSLDSRAGVRTGGHSGPAIVPGDVEESPLLEAIARSGEVKAMPPQGKLPESLVADFRRWVELGAPDPRDTPTGTPKREIWWSLRKLEKPTIPVLTREDKARVRTPIDAFILSKLRSKGLTPSVEADRRVMIRRVTYDLTGLPPSPEEVKAFVDDQNVNAYEALVDQLLASPRYGERWGRHWLDVVRYADTHGYDKDKPRPNAWPYRDYVVRSLNEDKPYRRFVQEQVAGDALFANTRDGIEGLGFIAAGPWDFIGHAEVAETKIDGQIARSLDRDDMVANTLNTFMSTTVQCARCHDHKFDPVTQEDYYSLQAVFAALDRSDKSYDLDPRVAHSRDHLAHQRSMVQHELAELTQLANGDRLTAINLEIKSKVATPTTRSPAFGYHSALADDAETTKWVQVDLGRSIPIDKVILHACDDGFNGIGEGFGFPTRFKVETADDPEFRRSVRTILDKTRTDAANPKLKALTITISGQDARYVRVSATKLAPRLNDYNFALAELEVLDASGDNVAKLAKVTALDTIESPPRWRMENLVDGDYPAAVGESLAKLKADRQTIIRESLDEQARHRFDQATSELKHLDESTSELPAQSKVFAGTIHSGGGAFRGTGPDGGKPRVIHLLNRGDVRTPKQVVGPGAIPLVDGLRSRFTLADDAPEDARRLALAVWLSDDRNPLTWRSIVNRIWHYHFGRGIVDTPNDFGRMGGLPSDPELLDWLAVEFRDGGQSIKQLHKWIVLSSTYRQVSTTNPANALIDSGNQYLWRMNRRKLEAEALRDSVLAVAGKLDLTMGGPGFEDFVVERPEHSPHYEYKLFDPNDPKSQRRSIYRMIVRSQPQPFLTTLDCADPSMSVDKRNESLTALQALTLLNSRLMIEMSQRLAERLGKTSGDLAAQVRLGFELAISRPPTTAEQVGLVAYARQFGLTNTCRVIFNLNEFAFVD